MSVESRDTGGGVAPPAEVVTLADFLEYVVFSQELLLTVCALYIAWLVGPERGTALGKALGKALRQKAESAIGKSQIDSVLIAFVFALIKTMFTGVLPHQTRAGVDMRTRLVLEAAGFAGSVSAICAYRVSSARAIRPALLAAAAACAAWAVAIALRNLSTARLVILALVAVVFGAKAARKVSSTNIAAYRLDYIKEGLVLVSGNLGMSAVVYKFGYPQDYASNMELAGSFTTETLNMVCWGLASALKVAVAQLRSPDSGAMTLKEIFMTYDTAQNLASYSIASWCYLMTGFGQVSSVAYRLPVFSCLNAVLLRLLELALASTLIEERSRQSPDVAQLAEKAAEGA